MVVHEWFLWRGGIEDVVGWFLVVNQLLFPIDEIVLLFFHVFVVN